MWSPGQTTHGEGATGRRPFTGDNPFAVAAQRVGQPPPPLGADVPAAVAALVERALAVDPEQRWPSAAALAEAALRVLDGAALAAAAPGRSPHPGHGTGPGHESRRISARRRIQVLAAAAVALIVLVGGGLAGWAVWGSDALAQWTAPDRATSTGPQDPAGYVACGAAACPPAPECWGGLTATGGTAHKPKRIACDQPHHWETVVVGTLPDGAQFVRQDELMARTDVAALCSAQAVAQRSRDDSATVNWRREAWPIQVGQDTWLLYCLASAPEGGETTGSPFRAAG